MNQLRNIYQKAYVWWRKLTRRPEPPNIETIMEVHRLIQAKKSQQKPTTNNHNAN